MKKYRSLVALSLLLFVAEGAIGQTEFMSMQKEELTNSAGWRLVNRVAVSHNQNPKDLFKSLSACQQSEVLTFKADGTYSRTFAKKDCAGAVPKNTNGTWKALSDPKNFETYLVLKLKDLTDDKLSQDYQIVSLSPDWGGLILAPMANQNPLEEKLILTFRNNNKGEGRPSYSADDSNSPAGSSGSSDLEKWFKAVKKKEVAQTGQPMDEVFDLSTGQLEYGVLNYDNLLTGTGPYNLVNYSAGAKGNFLVDIQTDYTGSSLSIYQLKGTAWVNATDEILGADFVDTLLEEGFDYWKERYDENDVAKSESTHELIFSLPVDNFMTVNPQIYVELKVTWEGKNGNTNEDARILGFINFTNNSFDFSWME